MGESVAQVHVALLDLLEEIAVLVNVIVAFLPLVVDDNHLVEKLVAVQLLNQADLVVAEVHDSLNELIQ